MNEQRIISAIIKKAASVQVESRTCYVKTKDGMFAHFPLDREDGHYDAANAALGVWKEAMSRFPLADTVKELRALASGDARRITTASYLEAATCASDDETRYFMNGVGVFPSGAIAATDGRRLYASTWRADAYADRENAYIALYKKTFSSLVKMFDGIAVYPKVSAMRVGEVGVYIKNPDGQYPNVARVFPEDCTKEIALPDKAFLKSAIALHKANKAKYVFPVELNAEGTWSTGIEGGPTRGIGANSFAEPVRFDAKYLLNAVELGVTSLAGTEPRKAFQGATGSGARWIVMPMLFD